MRTALLRSTAPLALLAFIACSSSAPDDAQSSEQASDIAGTFEMVAAHSGKCADVTAWSDANGTILEQWTCGGSQANQAWQFSAVAGGSQVRSVSSGKCLDVKDWNAANGARIEQWDCAGTANQAWVMVAQGGGYALRSVFSGKCLDVTDVSTADGAQLQQWDCAGSKNQTFALKAAGAGGGGAASGACSGGQLAACNCPNGFSCCPTDGSCFASADQVVYTKCKDSPGSTCTMGGASSSPPPAPSPSPAPTPSPGGAGGARLRVTNHCAQPIWLSHSDNVPDAQNVMLATGQSHDVAIPDGALSATRFWPKTGCDATGHACATGDDGEGGGKPCPATGCQPPFDSKLEVSFGAKGGTDPTWYNLSQVDGYTLPFKVVPSAQSGSCVVSDCSGLSLDRCPGDENMSGGGAYPTYTHEDLRVRDGSGKVIACMAPCKKWNYPAPYGLGQPEGNEPGLHMCCPTPIDPASGQCTEANRCMSSPACNAASDPVSVVHTSYVAAIHAMCPSAYSFAYDDAAGLHQCPSTTSFELTYCP